MMTAIAVPALYPINEKFIGDRQDKAHTRAGFLDGRKADSPTHLRPLSSIRPLRALSFRSNRLYSVNADHRSTLGVRSYSVEDPNQFSRYEEPVE